MAPGPRNFVIQKNAVNEYDIVPVTGDSPISARSFRPVPLSGGGTHRGVFEFQSVAFLPGTAPPNWISVSTEPGPDEQGHSQELERTVQEVEASREQIQQQATEVSRLYDQLAAEHQRLVESIALPGAMVGVIKDEPATPWWRSLWLRHRWLQLNLITAFVAAGVIGMFQETIDRLLILTMFLPVLAGQSGNTGSQALAVTLRAVFMGELELGQQKALVIKEALLGLLNGALVGIVAATSMYVVAIVKHMPNAHMLSLVVFLAMVGSCVISGACGAVMPLILKKLGADPVIASSIFLTTATNVASMALLLGLATLLVK